MHHGIEKTCRRELCGVLVPWYLNILHALHNVSQQTCRHELCGVLVPWYLNILHALHNVSQQTCRHELCGVLVPWYLSILHASHNVSQHLGILDLRFLLVSQDSCSHLAPLRASTARCGCPAMLTFHTRAHISDFKPAVLAPSC